MKDWNIITQISSGFSLLAFIVAVAGIAFRSYLKSGNPELALNVFKISAKGMSNEQKSRLANKEIDFRFKKLLVAAVLVVVVTLLVAFVSWLVFRPPSPIVESEDDMIARSQSADCAQFRKARDTLPDGKSFLQIGVFYELGKCVKMNGAKAAENYQAAANHLEWDGLVQLGALYAAGFDGKPADFEKAKEYDEKAIAHGEPRGYTLLGSLYENNQVEGFDAKKSTGNAIDFYQKAIQHGDPRGATLLGALYLNNRVVPKDCKKGIDLLTVAYAQHEPRAATLLGERWCKGDCVEKTDLGLARRYLHEGEEWGDQRATVILNSGECPPP